MNIKLSAIIITRNEEERIGKCLDSVKWVEEVIVVDNGSTDKTVEVAKSRAKVFEHTKGGFSGMRNRGAREAVGKWLLYVDADEIVNSLLHKEIISKVQSPESKYVAYAIPRKNILLGREMKYGGWWPDYVMRLMKKDTFKSWKGELHEQPEISGEIGKLKNPLIHSTHRNLTEMVEKTNEWSEIEAKLMFEAGHPKMTVARFFTAMFREFWYRGIREKGFLDGPIGIIEIVYQVFSRFVSYAKLWEMQIGSSKLKVQNSK